MTILTRDFYFADIRRYPPTEYHGIVVINAPDTTSATAIALLVEGMLGQTETLELLPGRLAILEFGRVRLHPA